jgi:hypothetical protein
LKREGIELRPDRFTLECAESPFAPKVLPMSSVKTLPMCPERTPYRSGGKGGNRTLDPGIMSAVL